MPRPTPGRRTTGAWLAALVAGALAALLVLTGCGPGHNGAGTKAAQNANQVSASVSAPADGATEQPASTELTVRTQHAASTTVALVDGAGKQVPGAFRVDGSAWVPDGQLAYGTTYTATVTATSPRGRTATDHTRFTTMQPPGKTVGMHTFLGDGQVVGVAAPLVVTFDAPIPQDQRAAVEKRLFVTATPAQPGSWYWFSDREVHYRPQANWQTGTRIALRAELGGLPLGNGSYGRYDLSLNLSVVNQALAISVDDTTKTLTVTRDGGVVKTMPASLGKDSTPSSSGSMVVMSRETSAIFDSSTFGVPVNSPQGYRATVLFPLRLTWGGQYIHAAPWSVAEQGKNNVSHGCTNISTDNAHWLYDNTHVGDPVTVKNTIGKLTWGDGWTDWDKPWTQYRKGSALQGAAGSAPYDYSAPGTAPAVSGSSASPSASPSQS